MKKKHLLKLSTVMSLPLVSLVAISCSDNQNIPPREYELIDEEHGFAFNSIGEITRYIYYQGNDYTNIIIPEYLTNNTKYTLDEYKDYTQRITSIGNGVFSTGTYSSGIPLNPYAQYLTSISLPNSIESIGANAFQGTPLTEIIIPESVVSIGDGAFQYCKNLTNVKLSKNTKYIGSGAFSGTGITSIEIPDSVLYINSSAFYNSKLSGYLEIPDSVAEINLWAFYGTQITDVSIPETCKYETNSFPPGCNIEVRRKL